MFDFAIHLSETFSFRKTFSLFRSIWAKKSFQGKCWVFLSYLNLNLQVPTKYSNSHIRLLLSPNNRPSIAKYTARIALAQFCAKALKIDKDSQLSIMSTERLVFLIGFRGNDLQMVMYVYVALLRLLSYGM